MEKDIRRMKHFRKWAEDKSPLLSISALQIAGFSQECFELFESIRKDKRLEGDIPLPSLKRWLKLYHNPKRVGRVLREAIRNIDDNYEKLVNIMEELMSGAKQLQKMTAEQINDVWAKLLPDERKKIIEENLGKIEEYKDCLIDDFIVEPTEEQKIAFRRNLTKPEIIFFFRVMAPCLSLYGEYPIDLLRKARQGDEDALEKLIKLDKSAIFDTKISEIVHQAQAMKKRGKLSMIKKAFNSSPRVKTDMKTIKCSLGGLISHISIAMKQKIPAVEIGYLYNALAHDMGIDYVDPDLGDMTPENFGKAIQRARIFWQALLQVDKK